MSKDKQAPEISPDSETMIRVGEESDSLGNGLVATLFLIALGLGFVVMLLIARGCIRL